MAEEEKIDPSSTTVVVTGASGFVGSYCVRELSKKGYHVIGTVRGNPDADKYAWIKKLSTHGTVELAPADLLAQGL